MRRIVGLLIWMQIPWLAAQAQNVTQYKTVYSSGGYMYETDTLESSMSVPYGVAKHTITAAFSLKKPDGSLTPFSASQQGDASQYFDPSADGDIPIAEIGTYEDEQDDEAVCTIAGIFFVDDVFANYIPPPELDAVQNWGPMTNTFSVDSSGTMVLYGYSLLCENTCSVGQISLSFSPSDSNVQTSISTPGDEQINLNYTINAGAIAGTHTVCITTPYPPQSCSNFIVGDGTPVITSISPSTWTAGASVPITIIGSNFGTAIPANANTSLIISPSSVATFTVQSWTDKVIQATALVSQSASGSASLAVTSTGFGNGFQSGGGSQSQKGLPASITVTQPASMSFSWNPLTLVQAWGYPSGGTFSGSFVNGGPVGSMPPLVSFSAGTTPYVNPTAIDLQDPSSVNGNVTQGASGRVTIKYTASTSVATQTFEVATFGVSCYITTSENDYWNGSTCSMISANGVTYSGTTVNPPGLTGTYCQAFLKEVLINGSGVSRSGQDIAANASYLATQSNWAFVQRAILTASGVAPTANSTIAVDKTVIPISPNTHVTLDSLGSFLAQDTGAQSGTQAIVGNRIDVYKGIGQATGCPASFSNPIVIGVCSPQTPQCPAQTIPNE